MAQLASLAPDGTYSYEHAINAYSARAQQLKEQFMRDARRLLKQTGELLARFGWSECEIRVNPGGVGVSGDVCADFWNPADPLIAVHCNVGVVSVPFGRRNDGIAIVMRVDKREVHTPSRPSSKPIYRIARMGNNQWINANVDSAELADAILAAVKVPETGRMIPGLVYHSRTSGVYVVPPPGSNYLDGQALKDSLTKAIEAAQADAHIGQGGQTVGEAKAGLQQLSLFDLVQEA